MKNLTCSDDMRRRGTSLSCLANKSMASSTNEARSSSTRRLSGDTVIDARRISLRKTRYALEGSNPVPHSRPAEFRHRPEDPDLKHSNCKAATFVRPGDLRRPSLRVWLRGTNLRPSWGPSKGPLGCVRLLRTPFCNRKSRFARPVHVQSEFRLTVESSPT